MNHFKSISLFSIFLFCVNTRFVFSQSSSRFSFNKYIEKGDTLNYRQLIPDTNTLRRYPLVIFLHGSGERGNEFCNRSEYDVAPVIRSRTPMPGKNELV